MKPSSVALSAGKMVRTTNQEEWVRVTVEKGAKRLLLEQCDDMLYATNADRSIIYGNWSVDKAFGWLYAIPMRWSTRYRKFKEMR